MSNLNNSNITNHFKMYKAGKLWLIAGLSICSLALFNTEAYANDDSSNINQVAIENVESSFKNLDISNHDSLSSQPMSIQNESVKNSPGTVESTDVNNEQDGNGSGINFANGVSQSAQPIKENSSAESERMPNKANSYPNNSVKVVDSKGVDTTSTEDSPQLYKIIKRKYQINVPGKSPEIRYQTIRFRRELLSDAVTGKKTYSNWKSVYADSMDIPDISGYTSSIKSSQSTDNINIGLDEANTPVMVTYQPKPKIVIGVSYGIYIGKGNSTLVGINAKDFTGYEGETIPFTPSIPEGWEVVAGTKIPSTITFSKEKNHTDIDIPIVPKLQNMPKEKVNVSRTIIIKNPLTGIQKIVQTATLTHMAVKDLSEHEWYTHWTSATFDDYTVPVIQGFTPTMSVIKSETVAAPIGNQVIEVSYLPNNQNVTLLFTTNDGEVVGEQLLSGALGKAKEVNIKVPDNYSLITGESIPKTIKFTGYQPSIIPIRVQLTKKINSGSLVNQALSAASQALSAATKANSATSQAMEAASSANTATAQAKSASSTANLAASAAMEAVSSASAAADQARNASSTANSAASAAMNAASSASAATDQAKRASSVANSAASAAMEAVSSASAATDQARNASSTANSATSVAMEAVSSANIATAQAKNTLSAANSAANAAMNAASSASAATDQARNASSTANSAASAAMEAVSSANTATDQAKNASSTANSAASAAMEAVSSANTATDQAKNASSTANSAASAAMEAASSASAATDQAKRASSATNSAASAAMEAVSSANTATNQAKSTSRKEKSAVDKTINVIPTQASLVSNTPSQLFVWNNSCLSLFNRYKYNNFFEQNFLNASSHFTDDSNNSLPQTGNAQVTVSIGLVTSLLAFSLTLSSLEKHDK